jgi:hypothetical protein
MHSHFMPHHLLRVSSLQLFFRVVGFIAVVLALASHGLVQADCTSTSSDGGITLFWTCSGTINDVTIAGTANNDIFRLEQGSQGRLTIQANGSTMGYDEINFFFEPKNLTINLSNQSSFQTVYAGLEIWFQGFVRASIVGGNGDDILTGTDGDDSIQGTSGKDIIDGGAGNDSIQGGAHEDILYGGPGDDLIQGLLGNDTIDGGVGNDSLYGDDGDDSIDGGDGNDTITGGNGTDTYVSTSNNNINLDLNMTTAQNTGDGNDTVTQVENAITGDGNDTIIGNSNANVINAGGGNDSIIGGAGKDSLSGGSGDDLLVGGTGIDTINGDADADTRDDTDSACNEDTIISIEHDTCPPKAAPEPFVEARGMSLCITHETRVALNDRGVLTIFSDFGATPNGMIITEIPLRSLRNPTDEEKAAAAWVPLTAKDSEFAPGWSVGLYWHDNHYGVQVFRDGTLIDDTGAICGWF